MGLILVSNVRQLGFPLFLQKNGEKIQKYKIANYGENVRITEIWDFITLSKTKNSKIKKLKKAYKRYYKKAFFESEFTRSSPAVRFLNDEFS